MIRELIGRRVNIWMASAPEIDSAFKAVINGANDDWVRITTVHGNVYVLRTRYIETIEVLDK